MKGKSKFVMQPFQQGRRFGVRAVGVADPEKLATRKARELADRIERARLDEAEAERRMGDFREVPGMHKKFAKFWNRMNAARSLRIELGGI